MSTQTDSRPPAAPGLPALHHAARQLVQEQPTLLATKTFVAYEPTVDALLRKVVAVHVSATSTALIPREPATWLDVAKQTDHPSLEDAVLESSVREVMANNAMRPNRRLAVSMDASAHALSDRSFPRRLVATVAEHGMNPEQMTVCIAQDALPPDARRAEAIAASIRSTGCRLAVRAFGPEQRSLAQLVRVPVDVLRLDSSCVATVDSDPDTLRTVRRLIRFARGIGVLVVAEGVERLTQYEHLQSLGCRYIQGPLAGMPGPLLQAAGAVIPGGPVIGAATRGRTVV